MAVFVSATVVQGASGKVLVPWEVFQCSLETQPIKEFCKFVLFPKIASDVVDISQVRCIKQLATLLCIHKLKYENSTHLKLNWLTLPFVFKIRYRMFLLVPQGRH